LAWQKPREDAQEPHMLSLPSALRGPSALILAAAILSIGACKGGDDSDTRIEPGPAFCGDGTIDNDEACDDGDANSDTEADACRVDCSTAICGDSVVDSGESCDAGADNSDTIENACRTDCSGLVCTVGECGPFVPIHEPLRHLQNAHGFFWTTPVAGTGSVLGQGKLLSDEVRSLFISSPDGTSYTVVSERINGRPAQLESTQQVLFRTDGGLAIADLASPAPVMLSGSDQVVQSFWPSDDESSVIYAVTGAAGATDLYIVPTAGGTPIQLTTGDTRGALWFHSGTTDYGSNTTIPKLLPDGSRVIFTATSGVLRTQELYSARVDGSELIKLNPALPDGGDVGLSDSAVGFAFTVLPDSSRVIYVADQETVDIPELFSVAPDGTDNLKISGTLPVGDSVSSVYRGFTADVNSTSSRVIFRTDSALWSVTPTGADLQQLSGAPSVDGTYLWPSISPDGSTVVFASNEPHLYAVPITGGTPTLLTGTEDIDAFISYEQSPRITADGSSVIYVASTDGSGQRALFIAAIDGSSNIRISGPMIPDGDVHSGGVGNYSNIISPDGSKIVYRADAQVDSDYELYIVNLDGTGLQRITPDRLHTTYTSASIFGFDGDKVFFGYDVDVWTFTELYSWDMATSTRTNISAQWPQLPTEDASQSGFTQSAEGTAQAVATNFFFASIIKSVHLNRDGSSCRVDLPVTGASRFLTLDSNFFLSPDGQYAYLTYFDDSPFSFYRADTETCDWTLLASSTPDGGNVWRMRLSPDAQTLVYTGGSQLYAMDSDGTGARRLNGDLVADGSVRSGNDGSFALSPDGSHVMYLADQDVAGVVELYTVALDGTDLARVNGALVDGGDVEDNGICFVPMFTPDSQSIVYWADQETDGLKELFASDADGANNRKISGPLSVASIGDCRSTVITPDSSKVLYIAASGSPEGELFAANIDGSGAVSVSGPMVTNGRVQDGGVRVHAVPAGGIRAFYLARQDDSNVQELYMAALDGTERVTLNAAMVEDGDVSTYDITPDGSKVVYIANQDDADSKDLYVANTDGTGQAILVDLPPDRTLKEVLLTADGRVVIHAELEMDGAYGVYIVSVDGGPVTTILAATPGREIQKVRLSPDSTRIFVLADLREPTVLEYFEFSL
jgi:Tol biopolymer transport system component